MRHNNKINHLGRTYAHRDAMLSNMAISLIKHKRIFTTLAKAKELRKYIEPLITKSKTDTTHSRRVVFKNLSNKFAIKELFQEISKKIGARPGGYTRIIKIGNRLGDNATTCFIELVDYNELMLKDKAPIKTKTRRSRRSTGKSTAAQEATVSLKNTAVEEITAETVVEEPVAEIQAEETQITPAVETPIEEVQIEELPIVETSAEEVPVTTPEDSPVKENK